MKYDPKTHHRRSIRLPGYDYSQAGAYFITICCHHRKCRFGTVGAPLAGAQNPDPQMQLNEYGWIAYNEWIKLSERFSNFELDVFQIMPNHMHGIIVLHPVGAGLAPALDLLDAPATDSINASAADSINAPAADSIIHNTATRAGASPAPTGDIIGAYKSLVVNECLKIFKLKNEIMGKFWQRNYYEHIIRNEKSYQVISNYIINNPANWKDDKFFEP